MIIATEIYKAKRIEIVFVQSRTYISYIDGLNVPGIGDSTNMREALRKAKCRVDHLNKKVRP